MRAVGIVCEYNPFHTGHARHLAETRALAPDAVIVCCMSGSFVQRGDYAIFPKEYRAEAAVRCGADLVVELPLPWAISSAAVFARGGVRTLRALGCDALSFGSECGDPEALRRAAAALSLPQFSAALREALSEGRSFASARALAAERVAGVGSVLAHPNDNLAAEYLREAEGMDILCVPRRGAAHDGSSGEAGFASASALRETLRADPAVLPPEIPAAAAPVFARALAEGRGPVFADRAALAHMAQLRRMTVAELARLPDMQEGFEHRLFAAIHAAPDPSAAADLAKTKRFAHARIRRQLLCAYLGFRAGDAEGAPPYIRPLAFNDRGRALLSAYAGEVPLLAKPARARLAGRAAALFAREGLADDLYRLACPSPAARTGGDFYRASPVYVRVE